MGAAYIYWHSYQCLFGYQSVAGDGVEQPEAMAIADLGLPTFRHKPTTPIKQTAQAHRKTSFPI